MPQKTTIQRARVDKRRGKAASTQAGEFVREEMRHIREGKHGAKNSKQAIAIGLSKARRAGVALSPPRGGTSVATRRKAARDLAKGRKAKRSAPSKTRARAVRGALKKMGRVAATKRALARQARTAARRRGPASRRAAALKAARTRKRSRAR